jgi:signal transduction histidine kinase/CheY-like chemotaxis protein
MRLRSHLLLLILATLFPLVVFGVTATVLVAQREKALFRRGATERTLALLTAVDAELRGHTNSLRALGDSRALADGDLRAFHAEARRMLAIEPSWRSVRIHLPSGQQILDTGVVFGSELPGVLERPSFEAALVTGRATIGNLYLDGDAYRFPVWIPIRNDDRLTGVLLALVDPDSILVMLERQRLPSSWVGVVLDANRNIVARTVSHETRVGRPASESLRAALDRASEGWFHGATVEGTEVYTPYNRSPDTGWTVAIGIPAEVVEAGARRTVWILALGVGGALVVTVLLAAALGRRISSPITALASAARDLAAGAPPTVAERSGVREVDEVRGALHDASCAVRERENALRAADRAKDEFLAMLGHELRNPLGAISSAAQVLQLTARPSDGNAESAAIIARQVTHMTRMVDDLLDVSRVTTGRVQLARRPLDLAPVVAGTLEGFRASGRLERHQVSVELEPVWVEADPARMEQVVANLVGNAVKYTPAGGRIAVRAARDAGDAVVEVEDSGAGLPPELLPRVFDLFVQGERSLDRSDGGLGIGLTLVKRLVELHGGTVSAASEGPGRGSRFGFRLPALETIGPVADEQANAAAPKAPAPTAERRHRILVIEDNEDARSALLAALVLHGHEVAGAADGPEALALAAEHRPDVALVDIGLPGLDGYALARRLRALPGGDALVLVALTGYGQAESRRRAFEAGFDEYLTKPVSAERLVDAIAAARSDRASVR